MMPATERPNDIACDDERQLLKKLLAAGVMKQLDLPAQMEAAFVDYHFRTVVDHIRANWLLLIPLLAITGVLLLSLGLVAPLIYARAVAVILVISGCCAVVVSAVYVGCPRRVLEGTLQAMAVFILCLLLWATTWVAPEDPFHVATVSLVALMVVAVFTVCNLRFRPALLCVLIASALFFIAIRQIGMAMEWRPLAIAVVGGGLVGVIVGFSQEIRDRKVFLQARALLLEHQVVDALARELEQLSRTDQLTGLMNRRHFEEVLAREWAVCRRDASPLGLLFIDVDHFKGYNDRYGHPAGDACLVQVAQALSSRLARASDVVARYGGEEFVVVLPRTDGDEVARIAERILLAVAALGIRHEASSCADIVSVSIGAAVTVPAPGVGAGDLVKRSDLALYEAKRAGRHRVVFAA